jgi:hypothetical protein
MARFWREHWPWIVAPIVLVALAIALALWLRERGSLEGLYTI